MPKLSQETLTMLGVSVGLAALILTGTTGLRGEIQSVRTEVQSVRTEMQAMRQEMRTEIRDVRAKAHMNLETLRAEARADREALRAEAHADREALRADRETFERHIIRLTEQQGILSARVESIRSQLATAAPVRPPIP